MDIVRVLVTVCVCPLLISTVVPSLLVCLSSPVREVRRAALGALQALSGATGSHFHPITERLLQTTEEVISDPSDITQVGPLHLRS